MSLPITRKEIIRETYQRLLDQGGPGLGISGRCMYQTPLGHGCAVGVWINHHDLTDLNYKSIRHLYNYYKYLLVGSLPNHDDLHFWTMMQGIHDSAARSKLDFFEQFRVGIKARFGVDLEAP